jgi:hypothetical protein
VSCHRALRRTAMAADPVACAGMTDLSQSPRMISTLSPHSSTGRSNRIPARRAASMPLLPRASSSARRNLQFGSWGSARCRRCSRASSSIFPTSGARPLDIPEPTQNVKLRLSAAAATAANLLSKSSRTSAMVIPSADGSVVIGIVSRRCERLQPPIFVRRPPYRGSISPRWFRLQVRST